MIFIQVLMCSCNTTSSYNEIISEIPSPNNKYKIVTFDRNINATTEQNLQVSVLKNKEQLKNVPGNILILNGVAMCQWKDNRTILITISKNAQVFKKEDKIGDISVQYDIEQ